MEASTKNKLLILVLIFLVVVNVALMIFLFLGRPSKYDRHERKDGRDIVQYFDRCLDLREDQRAAFREAFDAHKDRTKLIYSQIEAGKDELTGLLGDPANPKVDSLIAVQGQLRLQEERELFRHMTEVYGLCDSTQREKLVNVFKKSFRKRHKK